MLAAVLVAYLAGLTVGISDVNVVTWVLGFVAMSWAGWVAGGAR